MARKNILSGLLDASRPSPAPAQGSEPAPETKSATGIKGLGALGAVTRSIDALAAKAEAARHLEEQLTAGSVIIELQPHEIERSFISDRLNHDDGAFQELVEAIRTRGQDSPILVRPHPMKPGKYQIAFGHRRARAAEALGIPVRAVVKNLSDADHVIAQGQENSARADLSFIERAVFASRLEERNFPRDVIMAALGADKTTVSKMLSVTARIPGVILNMITDARSIGRDRWHELATLFDSPEIRERAMHYVQSRLFCAAGPEERFNLLVAFARTPPAQPGEGASQGAAREKPKPQKQSWSRPNSTVRAEMSRTGKQFTIALKSPKGADFGAYIATHLDRLYEAFEAEQKTNNGD